MGANHGRGAQAVFQEPVVESLQLLGRDLVQLLTTEGRDYANADEAFVGFVGRWANRRAGDVFEPAFEILGQGLIWREDVEASPGAFLKNSGELSG